MFRGRIIDCFTQTWHDNVINASRCYHYSHYKSLLKIERYLLIELPYKHKIAYASFRCSNHSLDIEIWLHSNIAFHDCLFEFCILNNNIAEIECEYHAFFHCKKYMHIIKIYLLNWYESGTDLIKFYELVSTTDYITIRKVAV